MINESKIYVVMPAYNETSHIGETIKLVPLFVDKIIVVDDNSSDHTSQAALQVGDKRLVVIRNQKNLGVGGATMAGYRRSLEEKADIVVKLDSDGQMDPRNILKLISPIIAGEADYTKGFRFHDRTTLRKMPRVRLIGSLGLSYLVKMASGYWNIFDPTNGFTAIHKASLELLELDNISRDYYFETDMLCNLYRIQSVVKDVMLPTHYGSQKSMLSPFKALMQFPPKLLRAYLQRILWRYYIRDFSHFSFLFLFGWVLFLFGFIFGVVVWYVNASKGIATPTGTVMLSVVPLFLGFQMLLNASLCDVNNVPQEPLQKEYAQST
jgi:dolichol-phosphate mannosyltransferase